MKRTELRKLIREILNEEDNIKISKKLDKEIFSYQDLLVKKQKMIANIKQILATEKDPAKKSALIKKHNAEIKKINKKIEPAERKFLKAVDSIAGVEDEDALL